MVRVLSRTYAPPILGNAHHIQRRGCASFFIMISRHHPSLVSPARPLPLPFIYMLDPVDISTLDIDHG